jgi:hypothetical protein
MNKGTPSQQMIYSFNLLITKWTSHWMRQIPFGQTISNPYTTKENQPDEEFAARRSPGFPNFPPWAKLNGSQEECFICGFTAIQTMMC